MYLSEKNSDLINTRFWRIKYSLTSDKICGAPKKLFSDYMDFLCDRFREDVPLNDLYKEYLIYLNRLYGKDNKINTNYFNIKAFERHLKDMNLLVYMAEENYKLVKYVCYDKESYLKEHKINEL